ncbi:MAG: hypothetical protein WCJ25_00390 [Candidatus Moraniibacteriota bacterium]
MRNTVILDKEFFQGSPSKKCSTSPAMVELMKNPKIASVLLDKPRQEAFFESIRSHVGERGKLDSDTLRAVLGELYAEKNSRLSKGSVERIADALLTENRDPKYFTYPETPEEKEKEPELVKEPKPVHEMEAADVETIETEEAGASAAKPRTIMDRLFG